MLIEHGENYGLFGYRSLKCTLIFGTPRLNLDLTAGNGVSQIIHAVFGIDSSELGLQVFDSSSVTEKTRTSFIQDKTLTSQGMLACAVQDL